MSWPLKCICDCAVASRRRLRRRPLGQTHDALYLYLRVSSVSLPLPLRRPLPLPLPWPGLAWPGQLCNRSQRPGCLLTRLDLAPIFLRALPWVANVRFQLSPPSPHYPTPSLLCRLSLCPLLTTCCGRAGFARSIGKRKLENALNSCGHWRWHLASASVGVAVAAAVAASATASADCRSLTRKVGFNLSN